MTPTTRATMSSPLLPERLPDGRMRIFVPEVNCDRNGNFLMFGHRAVDLAPGDDGFTDAEEELRWWTLYGARWREIRHELAGDRLTPEERARLIHELLNLGRDDRHDERHEEPEQ